MRPLICLLHPELTSALWTSLQDTVLYTLELWFVWKQIPDILCLLAPCPVLSQYDLSSISPLPLAVLPSGGETSASYSGHVPFWVKIIAPTASFKNSPLLISPTTDIGQTLRS